MTFTLRHKAVTTSTNLDAREGAPGDVFTADEQTAGRGRLDHRWLSPPGKNLMMSVVFDVDGLAPEHVSTFPLMVGLAVRDALLGFMVVSDRHAMGSLHVLRFSTRLAPKTLLCLHD